MVESDRQLLQALLPEIHEAAENLSAESPWKDACAEFAIALEENLNFFLPSEQPSSPGLP